MAHPQRTDPGTALAERQEAVGANLPEPIRQQLALRQMLNAAAKEIAKLSWGQNIAPETARAIAEWGRRYNVDVTQEIDLLGNRVYLNARYYLRRLSELTAAGLVDYAYPDHIHHDARLDKLGERGRQEGERRLAERVRYNAPEGAAAIVVFRVKLKALTQETVGVNWAGGGVRKQDPVGEAEPVKTAESRAARRCLRQLVSHVPTLASDVESLVSTIPELEARIHRDHEQVKAPSLLTGRTVRTAGYAAEAGELPGVRTEVIHMADKPDPRGKGAHLGPDVYSGEGRQTAEADLADDQRIADAEGGQ